MGRAVLQYSHCTCDTAQELVVGTQGERAGARKASVARAAGGRWVGARARASGSWAQAQVGGNRRGRAEGAGQSWLGGRRTAWALGARPGRAGWPWAVHSVHSACFWPSSTGYFPESNFFGHCS